MNSYDSWELDDGFSVICLHDAPPKKNRISLFHVKKCWTQRGNTVTRWVWAPGSRGCFFPHDEANKRLPGSPNSPGRFGPWEPSRFQRFAAPRERTTQPRTVNDPSFPQRSFWMSSDPWRKRRVKQHSAFSFWRKLGGMVAEKMHNSSVDWKCWFNFDTEDSKELEM